MKVKLKSVVCLKNKDWELSKDDFQNRFNFHVNLFNVVRHYPIKIDSQKRENDFIYGILWDIEIIGNEKLLDILNELDFILTSDYYEIEHYYNAIISIANESIKVLDSVSKAKKELDTESSSNDKLKYSEETPQFIFTGILPR